jgi:glutamate N-acetyltransferase/amino-acid N-acetyltransferase
MKIIEGGVCAAKGFKAGAMRCGIRKSHTKKDLAMILSDCVCNASAVYTTNRVKASPILLTKEHLADGKAQAVIVNSGNANACAPFGMENARRQAKAGARALGVSEENVIVASTGVIGQTLPVEAIEAHAGEMEMKYDNSLVAAEAIMTTDTKVKTIAVEFDVDGTTCHIGGICKGSGMIHPNMCTMLSFITTDAAISKTALQKALSEDVDDTYNMISVDGDTSTNDTVLVIANGMAENEKIVEGTKEYEVFAEALHEINEYLAKKIAGDGEGATALFEVNVVGAQTKEQAVLLSKAIACSNLTKTAIAGHDANWGRIICAMGYSGAQFDPEKVDLFFESAAGKIQIAENGTAVDYSEEKATEILSQPIVTATADVKMGDAKATAWGCDLTHGYIEINADYRS